MREFGRSMIEMLGVLAVVGVLSIGAVIGYRYAVDKEFANKILSDASKAYVESVAGINREMEKLYDVLIKPDSGLNMHTMRTTYGKKEIRTMDVAIVYGIQKSVCKILVSMHGTNGLFVLQPTAEGKYDDFVACVDGDNTLGFTWADLVGAKYTCATGCSVNGHCDEEENKCKCDAGFAPDETETCQECSTVQDITLVDNMECCTMVIDATWDAEAEACLCPDGYYFNGVSCVDSGGFCVYGYNEAGGNGTYYADCAYNYEEAGGDGDYYADCAYTYAAGDASAGEPYAECAYNFTQTGDETTGYTVTAEKVGEGCTGGQYCILKWKDGKCGEEIGADATGTIHGRCAKPTLTYDVCRREGEFETPTLTPVENKKCPSGQYCILRWEDMACGSEIGAEGAATIHGRCSKPTLTYDVCRREGESETPTLTPVPDKTCPSGQYCILRWKDLQCSSEIGAEGQATIHGRCSKPTLTYDVCRQEEETETPELFAAKGCPDDMYCNLRWSDKDCTEIGAEGAAYMYGRCLPKDQNSPLTCPIPEEEETAA